MDRQAYTQALTELRGRRAEIAQAAKAVETAQKALEKLTGVQDRQVASLVGYEKAKAAEIAKAAGMSVGDVVRLAPLLDPTPASARAATLASAGQAVAPRPARAVPSTTPPAAPAPAAPSEAPVLSFGSQPEQAQADVLSAAAPSEPHAEDAAVAELLSAVSAQPASPVPPVQEGMPRVLPSIPPEPAGEVFAEVAQGLVSRRPNFTQQAMNTVFLDAASGVLVARAGEVQLDLGDRSPGAIVDAVTATVPEVQRILVTGGAPWHLGAERYSTLREAVAAWLNTPSERWAVSVGKGRDRQAGHYVHHRLPVGRYMRAGTQEPSGQVEIRSVGEWFDPAGAEPVVVRSAFRLLWQTLRQFWPDVVLLGSPSTTGRDLWSRTIPTKGEFAGGFPVMSEELRALMHATAGQGRTELITPPRVPAELPALVELDRTFAYARHTWRSGVGAPRRVTGREWAAMDGKAQVKAMMSVSHWHIRATVPEQWEHVGLLPAPAGGERDWTYPAAPGQSFTTWAGGAEVYTALTNPIAPWRIEVLDGLVWKEGKPLDEWSRRLKSAWSQLSGLSHTHADPGERTAAYLASRAVRSILLFGIGGFAARPRMVTGSVPADRLDQVPAGAEIIAMDAQTVTWQRATTGSNDSYAHPEWAAGVWSGARAALLEMNMRTDGVKVGALHAPEGSVVAFRTDAIYLTYDPKWPYHGEPGDYLLKGHLTGPVPAPASEEELLQLRNLGRTQLAARGEQ